MKALTERIREATVRSLPSGETARAFAEARVGPALFLFGPLVILFRGSNPFLLWTRWWLCLGERHFVMQRRRWILGWAIGKPLVYPYDAVRVAREERTPMGWRSVWVAWPTKTIRLNFNQDFEPEAERFVASIAQR